VRIQTRSPHDSDPVAFQRVLGRYLEGRDLRPPELIYGDDVERVSGAGETFTAKLRPVHTRGRCASP